MSVLNRFFSKNAEDRIADLETDSVLKKEYTCPSKGSLEVFLTARKPYVIGVSGTNSDSLAVIAGIGYAHGSNRNKFANVVTSPSVTCTAGNTTSKTSVVITNAEAQALIVTVWQ